MPNQKHKRYHTFDPQTGQKIIRNFDVDATPPSQWLPGTGPHSPEAMAKIVYNNRKHFKNKPKSEEQRQKMRDAKLGKKFTPEHCEKLAARWEEKRVATRERNQEAMQIAMSMVNAD